MLRCDNASVNISVRASLFREARGIRTETSCPYESHQMGTAERMNHTLETIACTVLLASGMDKRWWNHAILYAITIHNVQYSRVTKSSPHLHMFNETPDVSAFQQFSGEAWLHRHVDQRPDSMPAGNLLYLLDTPPIRKVISCGVQNAALIRWWFQRSAVELLDESISDVDSVMPAALTFEEVHTTCDLHGIFEGNYSC